MSWWVYLEDKDGAVEVPQHSEGGTYVMGGLPLAELNVTYNYGKHFRFEKLNGRSGADTFSELKEAVDRLGTDKAADYWKPTEGNVGYALSILLKWAEMHPTAVWRVS